jgi:hypothetical protein
MLHFSTGKVVDGLWVGTYEGDAEPILRRVEDALGLIKACDKCRYDRIIHDLERVWVRLLPGDLARFSPALRACVLDPRFVLAEMTPPEILAAAIVHEATHARLWHCGIGYEEDLRPRVEAICVRRELAFARKLPNGRSVREWAEGAMRHPSTEWKDAAFAERDLEGSVQMLHHLGVPKWLVRMLVAIRAWRTGRQEGRPPV